MTDPSQQALTRPGTPSGVTRHGTHRKADDNEGRDPVPGADHAEGPAQGLRDFGTRREAQLWAERTTEAMRQRVFKPGSEAENHTMGDLVERYAQDKVPHLVTPAAIASAIDRLARGHSSGKSLSPSTVRRYVGVLGGAFSTATKEWFWLEDNPCRKVKRPTEPRGRVRFLDKDERDRLLAACVESRSDWLYALVVTALCTGARQAELLNLKWDDVDLDRGLAVVHHSKNGERRALAITGLAEKVLRERSREHEDRQFVFGSRNGRPALPQSAWQRARIAAGIEDFRFHDLRHTFASYLAMSGATLAELAEALGHKTLAMVKRYAHPTEGHTKNVVARVASRRPPSSPSPSSSPRPCSRRGGRLPSSTSPSSSPGPCSRRGWLRRGARRRRAALPAAAGARELLLRKKCKTIVVATPPSVLEQWKAALEERFGLLFEVLDRGYLVRVRRERGFGVNPWRTHSRFLVSHHLPKHAAAETLWRREQALLDRMQEIASAPATSPTPRRAGSSTGFASTSALACRPSASAPRARLRSGTTAGCSSSRRTARARSATSKRSSSRPSKAPTARTSEPASLIEPLRQLFGKLAPTSPVHWISTMDDEVAQGYSDKRLYAFLVSVYTAVAVWLAVLGTYGILSNDVARRGVEIGLRMAVSWTVGIQ